MNGEYFERQHWDQLINKLLEIYDKSENSLKVYDVLIQIDKVNDNIYKIKDLFSRSQSEYQMKEAIYEIKSWLDNTEFNFYIHKLDSGEI